MFLFVFFFAWVSLVKKKMTRDNFEIPQMIIPQISQSR